MSIQHCTKHPIANFTTPRSGVFNIVVNAYWIVTKEDEVLRFKDINFLYNPYEVITNKIIDDFEGCVVKQIPIMFLPWSD